MSWISQGLGALGGLLKSKPATSTNTTALDANTQQQLQAIQQAYQQSGRDGPSPLLNGASQFGTQAQTAGNLGFGALSGDPRAVSQLMNPYQQQVIDANNAQWQKTNAQTVNQTNDLATRAGAFGGSRHGVAEGVALGNNNQAQMAQNAQLLSNGYGQAQNQANQLAGYGFQGANLNSNLGFGGVGSPSQWYAQQLRQGFIQPTGQTSTGTQTSGKNPISGALGGAISGGQAGGPWGAVAGGLLGLFS